MISKDMKYTALYWALHFEEIALDVYEKSYGGYKIVIDAEKQTINYGSGIIAKSKECRYLIRHKDFVILECVDRLLSKGYQPDDICIDGRKDRADIYIKNVSVYCEQWGEDYQNKKECFVKGNNLQVLYTSRLVSGLLEYKNRIFDGENFWDKGIFEDDIKPFLWSFSNFADIHFTENKDFNIFERQLVSYNGKRKVVNVPEGITSIAASAFWNNTYVEEVVLPKSLKQLGGDCFYYCINLKKIIIPINVKIMGNNPFAGCPLLEIENESPEFILESGVLYNKDKTEIIYHTINKAEQKFVIPEGIRILGKHCFFACNNLKKIVIPLSVIHFENNPFSGCEYLQVENHSQNYVLDNGVIYNKYKTSVIGCLNATKAERMTLAPTITAINRNSFWNCKGIESLVIPDSVNKIGYNPFAGCENMVLSGNPAGYVIENGIIFSADKTAICCATDRVVGEHYALPDRVKIINRGVFSGCRNLKTIDLNNVTCIDKSAFTNCIGLQYMYIPDAVTYIGEWAFAYCSNLKTISIKKGTVVDRNAFNGCPAQIIWRD